MTDDTPASGDNCNGYKGIFWIVHCITLTRSAKRSAAPRSMWFAQSSYTYELCVHVFQSVFTSKLRNQQVNTKPKCTRSAA